MGANLSRVKRGLFLNKRALRIAYAEYYFSCFVPQLDGRTRQMLIENWDFD